MEKTLDYKKLYDFQDKILKIIFSLENTFFLSGGTALHRFHYNLRYSDDLDFFVNNDQLFGEYIREFELELEENQIQYEHIVSARDFHRFLLNNFLQIDFVNDKIYRDGKSDIFNGMRIDNIINILTNKLTAILDRDEEKDIFDILSISYNEKFNWKEIINICNKKSYIENDFLIERLKNFPLDWLDNIKKIQEIKIDAEIINILCNDIMKGLDNSLQQF